MAAVKALSTRAYRMFRTRGYEDFVTALNALNTDTDNICVIRVDDTTGDLTLTPVPTLTTLIGAIADEGTDDLTISKDEDGVITAVAA